MTQTSRLVLEIDSRDAEQKAADTRKALEALEALGIPTQRSMAKAGSGMESAGKSAEKATGSIDNLAESSAGAGATTQKASETYGQASARLLAMAKSSLEASDYVKTLSASTLKAGGSFDVAADKARSLTELARRFREESDANVGTNIKQADTVRKAASATGTYSEELERLLGSIDPVRRKQVELVSQQRELAAAFKKGDIDEAGYKRFSAIIGDNASAMNNFSAATKGSQRDAAQLLNAIQSGDWQGVARNFQQISVSAGGAGNALKSLGGMASALINPFTIASTAVGLFAFAAYKGYEQAELYRKALTLTGSAAGKTADDLIALSGSIAGGRNFSEASQAVLALADNGQLVGEAFTQVARAATELSVATGKSAGDIANQLSNTKGSVTDLAAEYSDKYGVITQAVFDQVRSLDLQGDKMGAIKVLAGAVADEMGARNKEMVESTRGLAKAWDELKASVTGVWEEVKSGLSASPELFKLQHLQGQLQDAQKIGDKALITGLEKQVALAQQIVDAKTQASEKTSAELQERKATITADKAWQEDGLKYRTNQQKMEKDIADARARGLAAKVSEADIEQRIANIRTEYASKDPKEPRTPSPKAYTEDAGMKMLDAARQTQAVLAQQNSSLNAQGIATEKVGTQAQALIKWEQQLADIKGKKTLTADQKSLLASQDLITAQLKKNVALEKEAQLSRDIQQSQKDQVQLLTLTGQLRAANSLRSSLDYAAQMNEYERQGNVEAIKRLELMIKIRDINLQSAQKPGTVEGVSQAPQVQGLDASVGGAYSEIDRLNQESAKIDAWRAAELAKQQAYLDLSAISEETYAERVANIHEQGRNSQAKIEQAKNQALMAGASDFFGNMASLSQSGNKKLAAIGKAAAIAQATIDGYAAIQKALAAFPPPFNFAAAAAVGVATTANVANIAGIGFSGGGYTGPGGVNEEAGTVHKGEIVWSQKDIQRYGGVAAVESLRNGNVSAMPARASSSVTGGSMQAMSSAPPQIKIYVSGDGAGGSVSSTEGYEQMGQAVLATVRAEMPKIARSVIQQEKGQNGLLDPNNRRNAA